MVVVVVVVMIRSGAGLPAAFAVAARGEIELVFSTSRSLETTWRNKTYLCLCRVLALCLRCDAYCGLDGLIGWCGRLVPKHHKGRWELSRVRPHSSLAVDQRSSRQHAVSLFGHGATKSSVEGASPGQRRQPGESSALNLAKVVGRSSAKQLVVSQRLSR